MIEDVRFLPLNPITEWLEINKHTTDFRITVLNVTLEDLKLKIVRPFGPHITCMIERFERT